MSPNEAQNSACCVLERAGYKVNKTAAELAAKALRTGPLFVFEVWLEGQEFRRVLVGPTWVTVTSRHGCGVASYDSYKTEEYARLEKFAKAGEPRPH